MTARIDLPGNELSGLFKNSSIKEIAGHYNVSNSCVRRNFFRYGIQRLNILTPHNKGKTLVERYGKEHADEIRTKLSVAQRKLTIFQHTCNECGTEYENSREKSSFCTNPCRFKNEGWLNSFARSGNTKSHVPWNKGTEGVMKSSRKGKTHKEIFGFEKAKEMGLKNSKAHKGKVAYSKGKTLEEVHGVEKAKEVKENLRLSHLGKFKGELNPAWKGGISFEPYGADFSDELRTKIRERDGNKCIECSWTEEQLGKKVDVHHIDFDKKNNSPNNLVSLCRSCHAQTQFNRDEWTEYYQQKLGGDSK